MSRLTDLTTLWTGFSSMGVAPPPDPDPGPPTMPPASGPITRGLGRGNRTMIGRGYGPYPTPMPTPRRGPITRGLGLGLLRNDIGRGYGPFAPAPVPSPLPGRSDRVALDAIADLLRATDAFDRVYVGKPSEATPKGAKFGALAILDLAEDPQTVPDWSPLMPLNRAAYNLTLHVRGDRSDDEAHDRLDQLKRIALNAVTAQGKKRYGGFCLTWYSTLRAVGRPRPTDIGMTSTLRGTFAYNVDMSAARFSEVR